MTGIPMTAYFDKGIDNRRVREATNYMHSYRSLF